MTDVCLLLLHNAHFIIINGKDCVQNFGKLRNGSGFRVKPCYLAQLHYWRLEANELSDSMVSVSEE